MRCPRCHPSDSRRGAATASMRRAIRTPSSLRMRGGGHRATRGIRRDGLGGAHPPDLTGAQNPEAPGAGEREPPAAWDRSGGEPAGSRGAPPPGRGPAEPAADEGDATTDRPCRLASTGRQQASAAVAITRTKTAVAPPSRPVKTSRRPSGEKAGSPSSALFAGSSRKATHPHASTRSVTRRRTRSTCRWGRRTATRSPSGSAGRRVALVLQAAPELAVGAAARTDQGYRAGPARGVRVRGPAEASSRGEGGPPVRPGERRFRRRRYQEQRRQGDQERCEPQRHGTADLRTAWELGSCAFGRLAHPVLQVGHSRSFDGPDLLERQVRADAVEEPRAAAEHQRDDVQLELVDQPRRQVLVDGIGASADRDVLAGGRLPWPARGRTRSRR